MAVERQLETSRLQALDMIKTYSLTASIGVADAMSKATDMEPMGSEGIDTSLVTVMVQGDVGAIKAATEAGAEAASRAGECISVHVIPRPHGNVSVVLLQAK